MANEFKHKDPGSALTQAEFIASDGTGHIFDSQAAGDILYASSTTVLARLAKATDGNVLELASGLPAWTASPTIGSTSWANANHAHAASNSGGTLTTLGTVTTGVWQGTAIASGYIAADAITGAKIADDAVDSEHYTDGSIDTAHIADNQVTVAKIEDIARGSIIYGNASAASAELTKGSANYVLTSDGTDIAWAAAAGGDVVDDTSPQLGGNLDMQARLLVGNGGSTGIAISANGEVTMAAQPAVTALNSATDSNVIGAGTTTIDFDTEVFDQNADFDSNAFTAPIGGRYQVDCWVLIGGETSSATYTIIRIVASNRTWLVYKAASTQYSQPSIGITALIDMDASDSFTITVEGGGESSNVQDIIGNAAPRTFVSVFLEA